MFAFILITMALVIVWAVVLKLVFRTEITVPEMFAQIGISLVTVILGVVLMYKSDTGDYAIINGSVTGKDSYHVSCSHSYSCRCRTVYTGSGKSRTSHRQCDTCYRHAYDKNWRVSTTVGNDLISRVDSQGLITPPRWNAVVIGEPAAAQESYTNYVKASPQSLFAMNKREEDVKKYPNMFPKYPEVYDYYRVKHTVAIKTSYPELQALDDSLGDKLKSLGQAKQANILVVMAGTTDPMYRFALERHWVGGKKNDIIVILGLDPSGQFSWVDTITFGSNAGNALLAVKIRDDIKTLVAEDKFHNAIELSNAITTNVESTFKRKEMKDFKYLDDAYTPSGGSFFWFTIIQILVMIATSAVFLFNNERERR